jgi:hypothetical protein
MYYLLFTYTPKSIPANFMLQLFIYLNMISDELSDSRQSCLFYIYDYFGQGHSFMSAALTSDSALELHNSGCSFRYLDTTFAA